MADFLLEIGLEEIPARMIEGAEAELRQRVAQVLERESLAQKPEVEPYSTPRRLAVLARGVAEKQSDTEEQVMGPSVKVAYKDGQPTAAAQAFARKVNVDVAQLKSVSTPKGEYLAATVTRKGRTAQEILAEALPKEINALYWAKNMYWRAGKPERFVRPVRWMVSLLGASVVPLEYGGVRAGRTSRGHRLLGKIPTLSRQPQAGQEWATQGAALVQGNHEVEIKEPASYAADLKQAAVFARREERQQFIRKALDAAVRAVPGARWREDKELLSTVVNLTEFPAVILGNFEREFLVLPEEVLVTVMRDHQKYFAVEDASGKLAPHFLAVLNTDGDPQGIIRHGHERVLRARFNDARFFWTVDQKQPLRERVERLKNVTFQKDLGSYYDKTLRVQKQICQIAAVLKDAGVDFRPGIAYKAGLLAKTDLTTELVKEFTELQGVVGGLYAKAQGLDPAIGDAIYDQYKPESMEDAVPRTLEGAVLSLADKADSIAGMFALGLIPSGSKDPFALRRQANGIIKTVAEHKLPVNLRMLFIDALSGYAGSEAEKKFAASVQSGEGRMSLLAPIVEFYRERVEFYLRDVLGFEYDVVRAVLAAGSNDVVDAIERASALKWARTVTEFESVLTAFKRTKNILVQATEKRLEIGPFERSIATKREVEIFDAMQSAGSAFEAYMARRDYQNALAQIAKLREPIDTYFNEILVMDPDADVRRSRLGFLDILYKQFSTIADLSEIVTERK